MSIRKTLGRLYWLLDTQFGIDPRKAFQSLRGLPRYINDLFRFHSGYTGRLELRPCLHDWYEGAGSNMNEYFWQDLLVAQMIFDRKPQRHVDIGSRVDGFVAHVASFREIEVFDIRPSVMQVPGVIFRQADLMKPVSGMAGYCDSLSCLHALEHFGLGRYGDPIDPTGFKQGISNMSSLLRDGGIFYLSVPVGIDRVEFNAHRVFDPRCLVELAAASALLLTGITLVRPEEIVEIDIVKKGTLDSIAGERYALGIFVFKKTGNKAEAGG